MAARKLKSNMLHQKEGTVDSVFKVLPEREHGVARRCEKLSKNHHSEVFRELNITDYREVEPCNFQDYLSHVGFGKAILQCKSARNITNESTVHTNVDEPIPKKKTKRDEDDQEVQVDGYSKVICLDLLTKCVTHPQVVKLVCNLLTEQALTPPSDIN